jgi:hypothetical protein
MSAGGVYFLISADAPAMDRPSMAAVSEEAIVHR